MSYMSSVVSDVDNFLERFLSSFRSSADFLLALCL
jgi:hypothetical protein